MTKKPPCAVDGAIYSNNGIWYVPVLRCACGYRTGKSAENWEEAGAEYDEHLARKKR